MCSGTVKRRTLGNCGEVLDEGKKDHVTETEMKRTYSRANQGEARKAHSEGVED